MRTNVANKVITNLKWRKYNNLFKPLIKEKYKTNTIKIRIRSKGFPKQQSKQKELAMKLKYERQFHGKISFLEGVFFKRHEEFQNSLSLWVHFSEPLKYSVLHVTK